jgi:hypothetical protein
MKCATAELKYEVTQLRKLHERLNPQPPEVNVLPTCEKKLWRKYRSLVWKITEKQPIKKLPNYELRGFRGHHLDHKVSIWYGYTNKLSPELIGSIDNLEFIPSYQNLKKGVRCNFENAKCLQTVIFQ